MREAEKLRSETNKLEDKIELLVKEFIQEVGVCDVQIHSEIRFQSTIGGTKRLTGINVEVITTV